MRKGWDDARIAAEKVMGMGYELEAKEDYSKPLKQEAKKPFYNIVMIRVHCDS